MKKNKNRAWVVRLDCILIMKYLNYTLNLVLITISLLLFEKKYKFTYFNLIV